MQEITSLQLIETFKTFVTACQISVQMPKAFHRKWQVFSHYLNIYPMHSNKLTEYSHKCADLELESKFIEENMLKFTLFDSDSSELSRTQITTHIATPPQSQDPVDQIGSLRKNILDEVKGNLNEMRERTNLILKRFGDCAQAKGNILDESTASVIMNEPIKKMDAKQLRQRIIILKEDLKKYQDQQQVQQQYRLTKGSGVPSAFKTLISPQSRSVRMFK